MPQLKRLISLAFVFVLVTTASAQTLQGQGEHLSDTTITVGGVSFKMIVVEGGTFTMGDDESVSKDEGPAHSVTLSTYMIGETEVTHALW